MTAVAPLAETDVVILAGGLGTRLGRHIGTLPKALAPVANRPFLDHQLDWLAEQGARRIPLCLGHKSDQIRQHIHLRAEGDLDLIAVVEPEPRGTAGAVAYAAPSIRSDPVLVLNGDTYLDVYLAEFLARFKALNRPAALVCRQIASTARYGSVKLGADDRVLGFREKHQGSAGPGWINAGVYAFTRAAVDRFPDHGSLECDVLQEMSPETLWAWRVRSRFVDIGTPASLDRAAAIMRVSEFAAS